MGHLLIKQLTTEDKKCPKCGCQIYDPFKGNIKIHDVDSCNGNMPDIKPAAIIVSNIK